MFKKEVIRDVTITYDTTFDVFVKSFNPSGSNLDPICETWCKRSLRTVLSCDRSFFNRKKKVNSVNNLLMLVTNEKKKK